MKYRTLLSVALIAACVAQAKAALTVTLVTSPSWGTVTVPSSGSTNYALSTSTGFVTVSSGSGFSFGGGGYGSYLVTGTLSTAISYSVAFGSFSGSGISVVQAYVNGTSSNGTGVLSVLGTYSLNVGGVLSVASTATAGTYANTISVTVSYE